VAAVTSVRVALVDLYVLRGAGTALECLVLRRAAGGRCPGSWEAVHGHIEAGETPVDAARRELAEETGLAPERLYNLSRVETFYQHRLDEVALVPVFAAFVAPGAPVRLGPEHDRFEWLRPAEARARFAWPREARALDDAVALLGQGGAGAVEDVLRVC
jgi:dihydroneopterin triphosphate diphosphatase